MPRTNIRTREQARAVRVTRELLAQTVGHLSIKELAARAGVTPEATRQTLRGRDFKVATLARYLEAVGLRMVFSVEPLDTSAPGTKEESKA